LALATASAAAVQMFVLMTIFSRRHAPIDWGRLRVTAVRSVVAAAFMAGTVWFVLAWMPLGGRIGDQLTRVGMPTIIGAITYCLAYWLLGGRELGMLLGRGTIDGEL
jgi:peptidoglycan biosynthesis protein MviN/MurJ (putative lipid II flippase)